MSDSARKQAERFLREEREYNQRHQVLPSENAVIDRLLSYSDSMAMVYEAIFQSLNEESKWKCILEQIVSVAAFWSPERTREQREAVARLRDLNSDIAKKADELASLLEKRSDLQNGTAIHASDDGHPVDWIKGGAMQGSDPEIRYRFQKYVENPLSALRGRFDLKYWPRSPEVIRAIARYAVAAEVAPTDTLTAAAMQSQKSSIGDFFRALLTALDELSEQGLIPADFKLPDAALAEVANCALDLPNPVSASQVKTIRARMRAG